MIPLMTTTTKRAEGIADDMLCPLLVAAEGDTAILFEACLLLACKLVDTWSEAEVLSVVSAVYRYHRETRDMS